MTKKYITTAIPYVNGAPHIGHALDYLLADVYYRYETSLGNEVKFQAGTDEHGNKIAEKAKAQKKETQAYADENSAKFRDFIQKLNVNPTDFIRTTDKNHENRVKLIWKKLEKYIYPAEYEGWYCSGCENFITKKECEENHGVCPDHKIPYEKLSEKNYYLKLSVFKPQIKAAIDSGVMKILPEFRKNEVLALLENSPDVSISRPKKNLSWGIEVPDDDSQVIYVWLDALTNYITILGYPDSINQNSIFNDFWPASVQFVGKDILRFHAIIWPAILLGLGLPLPKIIHSHGHVLSNGSKMSKTLGNVVDPIEVLQKHGLPAFRYFFLRHIDTFADSDFTWEKFEIAYSNELANDLGNLVQRLATLCSKNSVSIENKISFPEVLSENQEYITLMNSLEFSKAFDYTWSKIQDINKEIDDKKPWSLIKTDPEAGKEILKSLSTSLIKASYLLYPFLPDTSIQIRNIFNKSTIVVPSPLFPKA